MIDQRISQLMNREVLAGDPETPLAEVVGRMASLAKSTFVVCEDGVPVGVLSERDAMTLLDRALGGQDYSQALVADVMTSPVRTLPENATMGEVIRVMKERGFRRVPIVDDKQRLCGIVEVMDLHRATIAALERRGRDLEVAVMSRTAELQTANAKLQELSFRDGLTGIHNRRAMAEKLSDLHALCLRYGNPYAVALIDIDHFKNYNDSLGHVQGDDAIKRIAQLLTQQIRAADTAYRYGGEEFLIAMPETTATGARLVAERVRSAVEAQAIEHPDSSAGPFVSVSLGYASVDRENVFDYATWEALVEVADRGLYRAKQGGRNRVARAE